MKNVEIPTVLEMVEGFKKCDTETQIELAIVLLGNLIKSNIDESEKIQDFRYLLLKLHEEETRKNEA